MPLMSGVGKAQREASARAQYDARQATSSLNANLLPMADQQWIERRRKLAEAERRRLENPETANFYTGERIAPQNPWHVQAQNQVKGWTSNPHPSHERVNKSFSQIETMPRALDQIAQNMNAGSANPYTSDIYRSGMSDPILDKIIENMREESLNHLKEKVLPGIEHGYIQKGAYHSGALSSAKLRAVNEHMKNFDKNIMEMRHKQRQNALETAHQHGMRNLEAANTYSQAHERQRAGLLQSGLGFQEHERKNLATEMAHNAAVQGLAEQAQKQRQLEIEAERQAHDEVNNAVYDTMARESGALGQIPYGTVGIASVPGRTPVPANPYAQMSSAASALVSPPQGGQGHARGGAVRRASGGAVPMQQDQYEMPQQDMNQQQHDQNVQMQQQTYNNLMRPAPDPRWDYIRRMGAHMGANSGGKFTSALGNASLEQLDAEERERAAYESRQYKAAEVAKGIEASRRENVKIMTDYQLEMRRLGENKRHNMAGEEYDEKMLGETIRHNKASEEQNLEKAKRKLTPQEKAKNEYYYNVLRTANPLRESVSKVKSLLDEKNPKVSPGGIETNITQNPFIASLSRGKREDIDVFNNELQTIAQLKSELASKGRQSGARAMELHQEQKTGWGHKPKAVLNRMNAIEKDIAHEEARSLYVISRQQEGVSQTKAETEFEKKSRKGGDEFIANILKNFAVPDEFDDVPARERQMHEEEYGYDRPQQSEEELPGDRFDIENLANSMSPEEVQARIAELKARRGGR